MNTDQLSTLLPGVQLIANPSTGSAYVVFAKWNGMVLGARAETKSRYLNYRLRAEREDGTPLTDDQVMALKSSLNMLSKGRHSSVMGEWAFTTAPTVETVTETLDGPYGIDALTDYIVKALPAEAEWTMTASDFKMLFKAMATAEVKTPELLYLYLPNSTKVGPQQDSGEVDVSSSTGLED